MLLSAIIIFSLFTCHFHVQKLKCSMTIDDEYRMVIIFLFFGKLTFFVGNDSEFSNLDTIIYFLQNKEI